MPQTLMPQALFTSSLFTSSLYLLCLSLMAVACSGGRPPPIEPALSSVDSVSSNLSSRDLNRLREADVVIIGETHDHPQHHLVQAEVIRRIRPKSVAFEMVNTDQQEALNQLVDRPSDEWDQALAWSQRGWPDFELYRPVFKAALEVGAKLIAAHPAPVILAPLKLGGDLPHPLRERLKLDEPLPQEQREALMENIRIAHCGHAPPALTEAMLKAQRLKDAWMSEALLSAPSPSLLIVGRGHVHPKRGIPWALQQLKPSGGPKVQVLSLSPSLIVDREDDSVMTLKIKPHRVDDPCERFREQLKRLRERMKTTAH